MRNLQMLKQWWQVAIAFICSAILFNGCNSDSPISIKHDRGAIAGIVYPGEVEAIICAKQGILEIARTKTDSSGYFFLKNLNRGVYNLAVTAPAYGKCVKPEVTVYEGGTTAIEDIYLKQIPEQILEINPGNGADDHPLKKNVEFIFTHSMNENSVENAFTISPTVTGQFTWAANSTHFSFIPAPQFHANTEYTVTITTKAESIYGDTLSFDYSFAFFTEKLKVVYTSPSNSANSVGTGTNIRIQFNSAMDKSSVESAFTIQPGILGDFIWSTNETVVFNPGTYLTTKTTYTISVNTTAGDAFGSSLGEASVFSFQTEALRIASNYPKNGATYIGQGTHIVISFNAEMNQNSVETAFSILPNITGSIMWDNFYQFRFKPDAGFAKDTQYQVRINTACADKGGKTLPVEYTMLFTTAP